MEACVFPGTLVWIPSRHHHVSGTNSTKPDSSRKLQIKGLQKILGASLRSLSLTNSFRQILLIDSFLSGLPELRENMKSLVISCFSVPFLSVLFSPTLIQGREVTLFKVQNHSWPTGGGWLNCFLLPSFLHTAEIQPHTHTHTHTHTYIYIYIYIYIPTHVFYVHRDTHTHTCLTAYFHAKDRLCYSI